MVQEILRKLDKLLRAGIADESQAAYLMVNIRKVLEHQKALETYRCLYLHCNWAVHASLTHRAAQRILKDFDDANTRLKTGKELPPHLRRRIDSITKMRYFEQELETFLKANHLPPIAETRYDGWPHFLHCYLNVISGCPLVIAPSNNTAGIESVTVSVDLSNRPVEDHRLYRVTWTILDKNGLSGLFEIHNSFSLNPLKPPAFLRDTVKTFAHTSNA